MGAGLCCALAAACARDSGAAAKREQPRTTSERGSESVAAGGELKPSAASAALQPRAVVKPAEADSPAAAARPTFRIARSSPGARIEATTPLGTHVVTDGASEVAIDFQNGARIRVEPGSSVWLLAAEPAAAVLIAGSLHAQLLPQGGAAGRTALRIVTRDYAASVPVAGELWIAQPGPTRAARVAEPFLAVLAGDTDVERLAAGPGPGRPGAVAATQPTLAPVQPGRAAVGGGPEPASPAAVPRSAAGSSLSTQALHAGQMLTRSTGAPSAGPRTLEAAYASYAPSRRKHGTSAGQAARDAALEQALAQLAATESGAREILATQRAAKQRSDLAGVQAQQKQLVALAQTKLAVRQRVRLAFELALAQALSLAPDALQPFEARFARRASDAIAAGL